MVVRRAQSDDGHREHHQLAQSLFVAYSTRLVVAKIIISLVGWL